MYPSPLSPPLYRPYETLCVQRYWPLRGSRPCQRCTRLFADVRPVAPRNRTPEWSHRRAVRCVQNSDHLVRRSLRTRTRSVRAPAIISVYNVMFSFFLFTQYYILSAKTCKNFGYNFYVKYIYDAQAKGVHVLHNIIFQLNVYCIFCILCW